MKISWKGNDLANRRKTIWVCLVLFLPWGVTKEMDPSLKNCMEDRQEVTQSSYPTVLAYFQKCLELGKSVSREQLPPGYFTKVVENMRESFEDFFEDSGLGEEQLGAIRKEIHELSGDIHHVPRKKSPKPSSKASPRQNETRQNVSGKPKIISNKLQSKTVCSNSSTTDQPDGVLHLQVVNNMWPRLYNVNPADDQLIMLNSTNSSLHNPLRKCGGKHTNGVEVLTLLLCIATLALCSWMAYKIYCQYQLWARVRYEASNHKTETTPLNQSESNVSTKNGDKQCSPSGTKRGFLP